MATVFDSTTINGLRLANRLVRSATWEGLGGPDGRVNDGVLAIYRRLAQGGVGLIITGYLSVRSDGRQHPTQLGADRDELVVGLAELAAAVHDHGGKVVGQIVHCGGQAVRSASGGQDPVAPSAVASPGYPEVPRELPVAGIRDLVRRFAAAAGRLRAAGFDGVQLHGAHGYLLSQFLSPVRNRRSDEYGGSLDNRSRFTREVYEAVRAEVGPGWPVMIKLNGHDFLEGSTTERDSTHLAAALAAAGIDAIEVSGGTGGSGALGSARRNIETVDDEGYFLPQARAIREAAPGVPLILVGGLRSLDKMEAVLASGAADHFAMSRPLIREPDLPARWASGDRRRADCVSCRGCFGPASRGEGIRCVNI
ncbi:MAG TPA: NADH:flavin oxidoreductase [Thermoanaerobaculales bacterium]|nr:NADH:flavin oxidoreductase [Thermoanaerobaculales bacterium]